MTEYVAVRSECRRFKGQCPAVLDQKVQLPRHNLLTATSGSRVPHNKKAPAMGERVVINGGIVAPRGILRDEILRLKGLVCARTLLLVCWYSAPDHGLNILPGPTN